MALWVSSVGTSSVTLSRVLIGVVIEGINKFDIKHDLKAFNALVSRLCRHCRQSRLAIAVRLCIGHQISRSTSIESTFAAFGVTSLQ